MRAEPNFPRNGEVKTLLNVERRGISVDAKSAIIARGLRKFGTLIVWSRFYRKAMIGKRQQDADKAAAGFNVDYPIVKVTEIVDGLIICELAPA